MSASSTLLRLPSRFTMPSRVVMPSGIIRSLTRPQTCISPPSRCFSQTIPAQFLLKKKAAQLIEEFRKKDVSKFPPSMKLRAARDYKMLRDEFEELERQDQKKGLSEEESERRWRLAALDAFLLLVLIIIALVRY